MYGGPWMYPLSPAPYTAWSHEERGTTLEDPFERLFSLSSNSVVGQRMAVSLGVELSNRFVDGAVKVIRTVERLMSEVMPLQVAPETLDVVQLREHTGPPRPRPGRAQP